MALERQLQQVWPQGQERVERQELGMAARQERGKASQQALQLFVAQERDTGGQLVRGLHVALEQRRDVQQELGKVEEQVLLLD